MKPTRTPLRVSREVVKAFELRTGYVGSGEFFRDEGLIEIVEDEECKTG